MACCWFVGAVRRLDEKVKIDVFDTLVVVVVACCLVVTVTHQWVDAVRSRECKEQ